MEVDAYRYVVEAPAEQPPELLFLVTVSSVAIAAAPAYCAVVLGNMAWHEPALLPMIAMTLTAIILTVGSVVVLFFGIMYGFRAAQAVGVRRYIRGSLLPKKDFIKAVAAAGLIYEDEPIDDLGMIVQSHPGLRYGSFARGGIYNLPVKVAIAREPHSIGYTCVIVTLPNANMPHIIINSHTASRGWFTFPRVFLEAEPVPVPGDLADYFQIMTHQGDARLALQLLTPDVLQALVGEAGYADIEIYDDRVIAVWPFRPHPADIAQKITSITPFIQELREQLRTGDQPKTTYRRMVFDPHSQASRSRGFSFRLTGWLLRAMIVSFVVSVATMVIDRSIGWAAVMCMGLLLFAAALTLAYAAASYCLNAARYAWSLMRERGAVERYSRKFDFYRH